MDSIKKQQQELLLQMSTGYTVKVFVATVFVFLNVILTFQVLTFFVPYSNSCNACLLFYVLPILYPLYIFFFLLDSNAVVWL